VLNSAMGGVKNLGSARVPNLHRMVHTDFWENMNCPRF
jgi:hypothetical protein